MRPLTCIVLLFTIFSLIAVSPAQQPSTTAVPNLINYSGTIVLPSGVTVPAKTVGVTFAIYRQQDGGAPIWLETQNVTPDSTGHYSILLGSTKAEGIPAELFNAQEQRWLGVQVQGQQEQPRVLLVSVPYALKAADAETLGGKPASAFQLVVPQSKSDNIQTASPPIEQPNEISCVGSTACKTSFIPMFSSNGGSAKVTDSILRQSGTTISLAGSEHVSGNITSSGNLGVAGIVTASYVNVLSPSGAAIVGTSHGTSGGSDGVDGVTTSGTASGVAGINQSGGVGVYGSAPNGDSFYADSNVQQARTMGGWVKGMVFYNGGNDQIVRCFNSTLSGAAATTPPCGFTTHKFGVGDYEIDFGFEVDDRFLQAQHVSGPAAPIYTTVCTLLVGIPCNNTLTPNQVEVTTFAEIINTYIDVNAYLTVY